MGAGGRLDPAKVIVTDLSLMQWDRTAIRNAKRAGNRSAAGPIPHEVHEYNLICGVAHSLFGCVVLSVSVAWSSQHVP